VVALFTIHSQVIRIRQIPYSIGSVWRLQRIKSIYELITDLIRRTTIGIIVSQWAKGLCRVENGIFYDNDTYVLVSITNAGSSVGERCSIDGLQQESPKAWSSFYANPNCEVTIDHLCFLGGGGPWEGEGFLAVMDAHTQILRWVLHSSESEQFVSLRVEHSTIYAESGEYPYNYHWRIPIENPEGLHVTVEKKL
jgi:hypothetical protein